MIWVKFKYVTDAIYFWGIWNFNKRKPKKFKSEEDVIKFIEKYNETYPEFTGAHFYSAFRGTIIDFEIIK